MNKMWIDENDHNRRIPLINMYFIVEANFFDLLSSVLTDISDEYIMSVYISYGSLHKTYAKIEFLSNTPINKEEVYNQIMDNAMNSVYSIMIFEVEDVFLTGEAKCQ